MKFLIFNERDFLDRDQKSRVKASRAFTLLFAVLVSSILLALGSAIFSIVSKQIVLSSAGRESQFAFFAADSGIECALYWDNKRDAFSSTSPLNQVSCGGKTADLTRSVPTQGQPFVTNFTFSLNDGNVETSCADVIVTKAASGQNTQIDSRGHNTCDTTNPLLLERAIRVNF